MPGREIILYPFSVAIDNYPQIKQGYARLTTYRSASREISSPCSRVKVDIEAIAEVKEKVERLGSS